MEINEIEEARSFSSGDFLKHVEKNSGSKVTKIFWNARCFRHWQIFKSLRVKQRKHGCNDSSRHYVTRTSIYLCSPTFHNKEETQMTLIHFLTETWTSNTANWFELVVIVVSNVVLASPVMSHDLPLVVYSHMSPLRREVEQWQVTLRMRV